MPDSALSDLKILDMSEDVAGPYATKLFGSLGATVVKVERPGLGDTLRSIGPFVDGTPDPDGSFPFAYFNTDKQSITLNIDCASGREIFKRLASWADILVESYQPGRMDELGLGYEELSKINPQLVMVSVTNFGQTGPYRHYAMTDLTAQAMGGLMTMVGEADREPLMLGGLQALCAGGVAAFTGAMSALMARGQQARGQHVDVSIFEMIAYTEWHATAAYAFDGSSRRRLGRLNPTRILRSRDGHMGVWVTWPRIKELMGEALDDERFNTPAGRSQHAEDLGRAMESWLMQRSKVEAYHEGQAMGQPWGYVATMEDLVESPQYQARSFLRELEHPVIGKGTYARAPFRIGEGLADGPWQAAPRLGEHNISVYGALLGYDKADLAGLRAMGVI